MCRPGRDGRLMEPRCPQCGKDFVRRSHREGTLEQLLSVVYVYPFRCQLCGHRFLALQWGAHYKKQVVDQREYERVPVRMAATFSGDRLGGKGEVTEISIRGCTLQTDARLPEGALLQVSVQPAEPGRPFTVEAAVVRSVRASGAGLEFLRIGQHDRDRLRQLLATLLAEQRS